MSVTRWYPDTCACVLDVLNDWTSAVWVQHCPRHSTASPTFAAFLAEHRRKNTIIGSIMSATPTAGVRWTVDPVTGALTVKASAIPSPLLANLQSANPGVTIAVDATIPPTTG